MMSKYSFLNGCIVLDDNAKISVRDLTLARGYGVFDYFQVKDNHPIHMYDQLDRLERSINGLRLQVKVDKEEIAVAVGELMAANKMTSAGIKIIATGGVSESGASIDEGSLAIMTFPFYVAPQELVEQGVKLLSFEHQRLLPHIKSINYLYAIYLSDQLSKSGAIEPLYYTKESVRETSRANVFAVIDGRLVTSNEKILEGITRKTIIEKLSYPTELRNISLEELKSADEVFLCGTTKVALGVTNIDGKSIGNGKVGPITNAIREQLLHLES